MTEPNRLNATAWDRYSQYGEDGIIDNILGRLATPDRWCVEFGAWDGLHLTNTRRLIEELGYSAVLIEGDSTRYESLNNNYRGASQIHTVNRFVRSEGQDSLDSILSTTPIPRDFDFLSIDIDGNDYHVWRSLRNYAPKVVVIEFNATMANDLDYVQPDELAVMHGSSAKALVRLGRQKGYSLVAVTVCNAFFVRNDLLGVVGLHEQALERIRESASTVTHISFGYDGTVILSGPARSPWHGIRLNPARVQLLPGWLRQFPDGYSTTEDLVYRVIKALNQPDEALSRLKVLLKAKIGRS